MKVLWLSTSTNNTTTVMNSLQYLGTHEMALVQYDKKWNEQAQQMMQSSPEVREKAQRGELTIPRERVSMDRQILETVDDYKPDVVFYISAWAGDFVPTNETLSRVHEQAPLVHICFDAGDPPWWPQMQKFEEEGIFDLTVNIDGSHKWPGGRNWFEAWRIKNGLTILTPCDPRSFTGVEMPFSTRAFPIGYGGNAGGWIRSSLVEKMGRHKGHIFSHRMRDGANDSYGNYAAFLRQCQVMLSIPFTGSNATTHVKGRVVESGWAGCCLLEWKNSATSEWFNPRADYWEYESVMDCLDQAEYLVSRPKMVEEIAANLSRRIRTEHSPEVMWGQVFERIPPR